MSGSLGSMKPVFYIALIACIGCYSNEKQSQGKRNKDRIIKKKCTTTTILRMPTFWHGLQHCIVGQIGFWIVVLPLLLTEK